MVFSTTVWPKLIRPSLTNCSTFQVSQFGNPSMDCLSRVFFNTLLNVGAFLLLPAGEKVGMRVNGIKNPPHLTPTSPVGRGYKKASTVISIKYNKKGQGTFPCPSRFAYR